MATLQWEAPADDSLWEGLKHAAGILYKRSGAYLTGQYRYVFHNETPWTAKLYLSDDTEVGKRQGGYFLMLPAGSRDVEIPMASSTVLVTGGFFRSHDCYEIFWSRRRFAWSPTLSIVVQPHHSTDANVFRKDALPNRTLVPQARQPHEEFDIFTHQRGSRQPSGQSLQVYTCEGGQWKGAVVTEELPGGLLQLEDGKERWTLQPLEQPVLVPDVPCDGEEEGALAVGAGFVFPSLPVLEERPSRPAKGSSALASRGDDAVKIAPVKMDRGATMLCSNDATARRRQAGNAEVTPKTM